MKPKRFWVLSLVFILAGLMLIAGCGNDQNGEDMNGEPPVENGEAPVPDEPDDNGANNNDNNNDNNNALEESNNNSNGNASGCWDYQPTDMAPNPGWDGVSLEGLTRDELVDVLGCPPHVIRMTSVVSAANNRELWVYHPYEEDPTGLFIWLKGDVFHYSTLNEFNGFGCYEMTDLDFWE